MTGATATTTETQRAQRTLQEILPPYVVILHNDDHHSMDYVVAALMKSVPGLSMEQAVNIMLEAHNTGRAVVITCPLEQAELYRDRIRSFGLGASIEKA
jgi:ATP-dependent Clp protease adaptor protein ClpS